MKVQYNGYDHSPPIIFLDTNVIVEMAEGLSSKDSNHRGKNLFGILKEYVDKDKILCPFVYQRNEYFKYFDKKKNKECDDILIKLSKGKQVTIVSHRIFEKQFKRMLRSYLDTDGKDKTVNFQFFIEDIFDKRFNETSDAEKRCGIKLLVLSSGFIYPNQKESDQNLSDLIEERRRQIRRDKVTKDQVFYEERRGRLYDLCQNDEERWNFYLSRINPKASFLEKSSLLDAKNRIAKYWKDILIEKKLNLDLSVLKFFINSDYFLNIPIDYISSILYTEILFSNAEIKVTDPRDIESLSIMLPYSTIAIVDKDMRSHIYKSNLHNTFKVDVYSLKSWKKFLSKIKKIIGV